MGKIKMKVFLSVLTLAAVYAVADVDEAAPNTSQEEVSEASPSQQDSVLDLNQEESKCIPPDFHPCALWLGRSVFWKCDEIQNKFSQDELDSIAKEKWSVATGRERDSLARRFRDEIGFFSPEVCLFQFVQNIKDQYYPVMGFAFGEDSLKVINPYSSPKPIFNIYRNQKKWKIA